MSILSRARFEICGDVLEKDVVPLLVKLVYNRNTLATRVTFTKLVSQFPIPVNVNAYLTRDTA